MAILFTFALGTSVGNPVAETFGFGFITTGLIFGGIIAAVAACYYFLNLDGVWAFWLAYIFTRPPGASLGDFLAQPLEYGGLGFGTVTTSLIFFGCIVAIVVYMTFLCPGIGLTLC
ncbi:putative membrane-anchored protein [Phyllobacterium myrsinacearum]|uniref:Putative membrane-anchored protein n=1 Tax=Phyllobacterium myrsinacearum TaxID=28101 RepID=A0A839ESA7_9HYPH|nr:putative membrane-anchored protein [Phyllobacterium myrsinacearum]